MECLSIGYARRLTEKDMSAYLMVYFKDSSHSLYMAVTPRHGTVISLAQEEMERLQKKWPSDSIK